MVQKINPAELVLRTEVRALDEINKAASMYSREHAEVMEAAKLVEQRRQNDFTRGRQAVEGSYGGFRLDAGSIAACN